MIFHQFFEADSSTYTYLLASEQTREAVLIDPVISEVEQYAAFLEQHDLQLVYSLDTHVHADHITAANELRTRFGCKLYYIVIQVWCVAIFSLPMAAPFVWVNY